MNTPAALASLPEPDRRLYDALLSGTGAVQRRALAKIITLLESTRADHRPRADALLNALLPASGGALRLGISGVPGVGKSTFIEALGLYLLERGHRVAVLAVDPSSSVSGGSILGDKTRMERLSVHERAFIRPSPAAGNLGGVAEKTRESLRVCEAAGFDVVIVETVGVGQSETAVAGMTDLFVLLQLPNAGDDLQAIKKGVMELADLVVINKADIDEAAATRARAQITSALRLIGLSHRGEPVQVLQLSALQATGWRLLASRAGLSCATPNQRPTAATPPGTGRSLDVGTRARRPAPALSRTPGRARGAAGLCRTSQGRPMAASVAARRLLDLLN
jgi:LAO/AO transport system kinase